MLARYVAVKRPEIIKLYNRSMGGDDQVNQLVDLYRIFIRSKKWTLCLVIHITDLNLISSCLEYLRDRSLLGVPHKML
jgi:hypothetical protein